MRLWPWLFVLVLVAAAAPAPAQGINDADSFMRAFSEAVKADDFAKQQDLVGKHQQFAQQGFFAWECSWCDESARNEGSDAANALAKVLEQLAVIYKTFPPRSEFLVKRYAWLKDLTVEQRQLKAQVWVIVSTEYPRFEQVRRSRSEAAVKEVLPSYQRLADLAEKATDWYWAAQGWWYQAILYELIPDWYPAVYCYKRAVEVGGKGHSAAEIGKLNIATGLQVAARTGKIRPDLVDVTGTIEESKAKYDKTLEGGPPPVPGEPGAPGGENAPGGAAPAGKLPPGVRPNVHAGKIEWEDVADLKILAVTGDLPYATPNFRANAHWYFWRGVDVKKDETVAFSLLPGPADLENDAGKVFLHPGGKGKAKTPIRLKLGAKPEVMAFDDVSYLDGSKGKIWHVLFQTPNTFTINGFQLRAGGGDVSIRVRGASMAKGKVRGQDLIIYDLSANGAFNDYGADCIVTGTGKSLKVQPLSKYITIDGLLYELKVEPNGKTIRTKPYDGPIAVLKFDFASNTKPQFMMAGGSGDDAAYFFDLMDAADHPIWVVPGTMGFYEGYYLSGKGEKAQSIVVTRGRSAAFNVLAAQENVWKMGGAGQGGYTFVFKTETVKENGQDFIKLPPKEIKIHGSFGEVYEYSMFGAVTPTVLIRKGKEGQPVITEVMKKPDSSDLRTSVDYMWFPKELAIKKTFIGDYTIKLEADYKPLGKIASDWVPGG